MNYSISSNIIDELLNLTDAGDLFQFSGKLAANSTINMLNGNNTFMGINTAAAYDSMRFTSGAGNDYFRFSGGYFRESSIDAGDGNNRILLSNTLFSQDKGLEVATGAGKDTITVSFAASNEPSMNLNINSGAGDDYISLSATAGSIGGFGWSSKINAGDGNDTVTLNGLTPKEAFVSGYLAVELGEGNNTFTSTGSTFGMIRAGSGNDTITVDGGFHSEGGILSGDGDDSISIGFADTLIWVATNSGNDTVTIEHIEFTSDGRTDSVSVELCEGDDKFVLGTLGSGLEVLGEPESSGNSLQVLGDAGNDTFTMNVSVGNLFLQADNGTRPGDNWYDPSQQGNDFLEFYGSLKGNSTVYMGGGDDTVVFKTAGACIEGDNVSVDGGAGVDTFVIGHTGSVYSSENIKGFEYIKMTGSLAETLELKASDLFADTGIEKTEVSFFGEQKALWIDMGRTDSVTLGLGDAMAYEVGMVDGYNAYECFSLDNPEDSIMIMLNGTLSFA